MTNSKIISFDGEGLKLDTAEDAEIICEKLAEADNDYDILILQGNTLGIEAAERVGFELAKATKLKEAHFKDLFTSRGKEEVPVALGHLLKGIMLSSSQLKLLDLSDNAIGPIGAPPIVEFLKSEAASTLEHLLVNNCGWGPEGSTSLASALSELKDLRVFICGRSRLEIKGSAAISNALLGLNKLEVLKLNQNGIFAQGMHQIAKVIKLSKETIAELDLSDNTIKKEGADALGEALAQATKLRKLVLNDALLENDGFETICQSLARSSYLSTMEEASFEGNEISGQKIVDLILSTFSVCDKSFTLNLLENEFSRIEHCRLDSFSSEINILIDDLDDDADSEETLQSDDNDYQADEQEEGEINDRVPIENRLFDPQMEKDYFIDVIQDFIRENEKDPIHEQLVNEAFNVLFKSQLDENIAMQLFGEELGLVKCETTGKKKPLARSALIYIGKRSNEIPEKIVNFLRIAVKGSDDLSCGKLLFLEKLEI